jgi:DNA-binding CsgD family transcriptional regulator
VLTKKQTAELTLREAQTLYYLLSGYSSKMIAKNLDISTRTVEIHIANIRKKTATHSRLDLLSQIINADEIASWLPNKK